MANGYAYRTKNDGGKMIELPMHNEIMGKNLGFEVDHINRKKLDNRRINLRFTTRQENLLNRPRFKNAKGRFKHIYRNDNRWIVNIWRHGKIAFLKSTPILKEALKLRNSFLAENMIG